jgi:hypothetical protein
MSCNNYGKLTSARGLEEPHIQHRASVDTGDFDELFGEVGHDWRGREVLNRTPDCRPDDVNVNIKTCTYHGS